MQTNITYLYQKRWKFLAQPIFFFFFHKNVVIIKGAPSLGPCDPSNQSIKKYFERLTRPYWSGKTRAKEEVKDLPPAAAMASSSGGPSHPRDQTLHHLHHIKSNKPTANTNLSYVTKSTPARTLSSPILAPIKKNLLN